MSFDLYDKKITCRPIYQTTRFASSDKKRYTIYFLNGRHLCETVPFHWDLKKKTTTQLNLLLQALT